MSANNRPHLPSSILAGVVLMFAMPLSAQAASYTYIDQKAPYQNGPELTALNLPKIGTTFQVQVPGAFSWSLGPIGPWTCWECSEPSWYHVQYALAFGVSNPNVPIAGMGGFLFSSAEVTVLAPYRTNSQQLVTMSFPIPNSPHLVGVRFYQQVLEVSSIDFFPFAYALSRGGVGVIGK
jgi:hypothetical protein